MNTKTKHPQIQLYQVESNQIHAIGHDPATNTLAIQFKAKGGAGSTYHYANFDAQAFETFKSAKSIGQHFGAHIKLNTEKHPFVKVPVVESVGEA